MWKLLGRGRSSPKLLVEPIKFLVEARELRLQMEADRDKELSELSMRWDAKISECMELKVNSVRKACLHTHMLQSIETEYAEYFGDYKGSVFAGFYCVACGQFATSKPETTVTTTLATPKDIHTLYGLK